MSRDLVELTVKGNAEQSRKVHSLYVNDCLLAGNGEGDILTYEITTGRRSKEVEMAIKIPVEKVLAALETAAATVDMTFVDLSSSREFTVILNDRLIYGLSPNRVNAPSTTLVLDTEALLDCL